MSTDTGELRPPLYILAGGQSSRFGQDKARAIFDGQPLILGVAAALKPATSRCTVVAATADKYADLGLETIADARPGLGPMAGLEKSLEHAAHGGHLWVAIAACDMVGLRSSWLETLLTRAHEPTQAIVYQAQGERPQPLLAIYHVSALEQVRSHLDQGNLAMWRLLLALKTTTLPPPDAWSSHQGINTPQDLQTAQVFSLSQDRRYDDHEDD